MTRVRFVTQDGNMEHDDFHQSLAVTESIRKGRQGKQSTVRCHSRALGKWLRAVLHEKHRVTGNYIVMTIGVLQRHSSSATCSRKTCSRTNSLRHSTVWIQVEYCLCSLCHLKVDWEMQFLYNPDICHATVCWLTDPEQLPEEVQPVGRNGNLADKSEL